MRGNWGQGGASGPAASGREQAVLNGRPSGPLQPAAPGLPLQPLWEGVFRPRDKVTQGTRRLREQGRSENKDAQETQETRRLREQGGSGNKEAQGTRRPKKQGEAQPQGGGETAGEQQPGDTA